MKHLRVFLVVFYILEVYCEVNALKILAIFPYTGKSHHFVVDPLCDALAAKGHEVTVISHFPSKNAIKTRRDITLTSQSHIGENFFNLADFEIPSFLSWMQIAAECNFLYNFGCEMCEAMLHHDDIQKLFKDGQKFDVAIVEQFNSDCALGIAHKLGAPAVGITSDTMFPWHSDRLGGISNPSFVPCHNLGYGTSPNLWQTATSALVCNVMKLGYYVRSTLPTEKLLRQHFGSDFPSMNEITHDLNVMMVNAYFPLHGSYPSAQNLVEVGGLYLKDPKELSPDLEKYISEAEHGVIYFSLGSMIKGSTIPPTKLKAIQDAFAELPQRVLWKWENNTMDGVPKNVMIRKWLPQFDVLNHKNVKAFFSHGGMLGTTEAVYSGVPMVAMPFYGDQFGNAAAVEDSGLGVVLHFKDITKETVLEALKKVLDPKMQESARRVSAVWRDRPMSPLDTAVYWVEHVARHGGRHLRPASADMPLYRYLLLDVIAFLGLVGFLLALVMYKVVCCLLSCVFKNQQKKLKRA